MIAPLAVAFLAAGATPAPTSPLPTIVLAEWLEYRSLGEPPRCGGPDLLCTDSLVEARMAVARRVSGPQVPRSLTVRFVAGGEMARSGRLALLVVRNRFVNGGPWLGFYLTSSAEGDEVCAPAEEFRAFEVVPPAGGRPLDQMICYRI